MKKILAVSLCAIMAVGAARADIASVKYVDEQITGASSTINNTINTLTQTVGTKAAQADLTALQNTVTTNESDIEGKVSALSKTVTDNKATTDKTQQDLDTLEATVAGLTTGDTAAVSNATFDEFKTANTQAIGTAKSEAIAAAKTETTNQIGALNSSAAAADGSVLTGVTITAGKITAKTEKALGTLASKSEVAKTDLATAVQTSLGLADSALQKADITTGTTNGSINVDGTDVSVKGLGSAAYTASDAYATAAQGTKADAALPKATFDAFEESNAVVIAEAKKAGTDAAAELNTYKETVAGTYQTKAAMATTKTTGVDSTNGDNYYPTVNKTQAMISNSITNNIINGYVGTLGSLKTENKETIVDAINEVDAEAAAKLAAVSSTGSGVVKTVAKDGTTVKVTAGAVDLADMAANSVDSSKIVDASVTKADLATAVQASLDNADSAMQESALMSLASWTSAKCGTTGVTCSLVSKDGKIAWEAVKY